MTPEYFFSGDNRDHIERFIKKVFATGHSETEAIFTTRDMNKIPYYFTGMAVNLKNQESLICVGLDISISKQSEKELTKLNDELRSVSAHLEKIREEEQARIAREVHDQLGQQLTILKMDLSWVQKKINNGNIDTGINDKMKDMKNMIDEAVRTVRKIASDLRPSILDDLGLIEALKWQSTEFSKRSGISVHFKNEEGELQPDSAIAIGLYRIYQEALTNVARHAEAKNVTSVFLISQAQLSLSITDDGIGFDMNTKKKTLGLLGMRERAYLIGGTVTISSEPGEGTTVMITVPFHQKENPAEE
jgi:signal transduction histidine kinase